MIGIPRKLGAIIAEDQFKRRKELFGEQAEVCMGCAEILICEGAISFQICKAFDGMIASGLIKGPKKIPWQKMRRVSLPIDENCLRKYGLMVRDNKLIKIDSQEEVNHE